MTSRDVLDEDSKTKSFCRTLAIGNGKNDQIVAL